MRVICQWIQAHGKSGMSKNQREKYEGRSFYLISKETSLKSGKKYKNHWQGEYHHALKERKYFVKCRARDSNLAPFVYEVSVLPIELSFRMKT